MTAKLPSVFTLMIRPMGDAAGVMTTFVLPAGRTVNAGGGLAGVFFSFRPKQPLVAPRIRISRAAKAVFKYKHDPAKVEHFHH